MDVMRLLPSCGYSSCGSLYKPPPPPPPNKQGLPTVRQGKGGACKTTPFSGTPDSQWLLRTQLSSVL